MTTTTAPVNIIVNAQKTCYSKCNFSFKRGIYIYGAPGSGKTQFVINLLNELNYDIIKYDAGDIRNKSIIDTITKNNMSDKLHVYNKPRPTKLLFYKDYIDHKKYMPNS